MSARRASSPAKAPRRSPYFTEEHEALRDQVRRFVENEIKPHALGLGRRRASSRARCCAGMGELGFFGIRYPAEYGGSEMDTLGDRRAGGGTGPLDLLRRRHHRAGPYRHGLGPHRQCRQPRRRRTRYMPRHHRRREDRRGRRHRARCRLGREGHPHHGAARGRSLRPQRRKDVHHQRRPCRSLLRRRQDRSRRRRPSQSVSIFLVEKGTPGFPRSRARSTSTAGAPPTPPSSSSSIAACRPRTCSGRRARGFYAHHEQLPERAHRDRRHGDRRGRRPRST